MSNSSYCQGLESCLEPSRSAELRVLRLKLAPQNSNTNNPPLPPNPNLHTNEQEEERQEQMGGWSFLQSLISDVHSSSPVYNPPPTKRSPSFLCDKSLEMCTESLGSETGSEVSEGVEKIEEKMASLAFLSPENVGNFTHGEGSGQDSGSGTGVARRTNKHKYKRSVTFPPPLTSISRSSGVQVRPHREGGRLVLEAVSVTSSKGNFHADRSNGRLTLRLTKDFNLGDGETGEMEEEEEEEENREMANRPIRRCKESESGNKGLLNWGEPCWVAT